MIEKYTKLWVKRGLYFFMEKLKLIFYRNLFKRVYQLVREPVIDTQHFANALNWQLGKGNELDIDEVECIIANLIYKGFMKGYVSHTHRKVVLSKKTPFPSI